MNSLMVVKSSSVYGKAKFDSAHSHASGQI